MFVALQNPRLAMQAASSARPAFGGGHRTFLLPPTNPSGAGALPGQNKVTFTFAYQHDVKKLGIRKLKKKQQLMNNNNNNTNRFPRVTQYEIPRQVYKRVGHVEPQQVWTMFA